MLILHVCLLVPLIQSGFSLIGEEEADLNSLSNYEAVDDLNESSELWNTANPEDSIVTIDSLSQSLLSTICKNSNVLVYIIEEDVIIDCQSFSNSEQPFEDIKNIVKRSADDQVEASGDDNDQVPVPEEPKETPTEEGNVPDPGVNSENDNNNANSIITTNFDDDEVVVTTPVNSEIEAKPEKETETPAEEQNGQDSDVNGENDNNNAGSIITTSFHDDEVVVTTPVNSEIEAKPEKETETPTEEQNGQDSDVNGENDNNNAGSIITTTFHDDEVVVTTPVNSEIEAKPEKEPETPTEEQNGQDSDVNGENDNNTEVPDQVATTTLNSKIEPTPEENVPAVDEVDGSTGDTTPQPQDEQIDISENEETQTEKPQNEDDKTQQQINEAAEEPTAVITPENKEIPEAPQLPPESEAPPTPQTDNSENDADLKKEAEYVQHPKGKTILVNKQEVKEGSSNGDESLSVDESTQNPKKAGSKDTTILIVLFAAVVVVGALAFGYNFIKKRRQQSRDLEAVVERGSLKRSFQNLSKSDPEPEKKPLIGDNKEVEMVNMKKETSELEAPLENGTSEPSVKT